MDDIKRLYEEMRNTWNEFKALVEREEQERKQLGDATAETKQAIERLNERISELETAMRRPQAVTVVADHGPSEAKAAFMMALRYGISALDEQRRKLVPLVTAAEAKALHLGDDTAGGYLAPPEFVNELIREVKELSPIRGLARVRTTSARSVIVPVKKGAVAANWVSERGQRSEDLGTLKFGREEIPAHEMYAEVRVSEQDLEDSAFDLEAEIRTEMGEQFAVAEGEAFVLGDGVGKPEGILTNSNVAVVKSGNASTITADSLIDLAYSLKAEYARNAVFGWNRKVTAAVRKLKDANNQYLWQPGLAASQPNTVLDRPYVEIPDMPDIAANAYPVFFGDLRRAYTIVDRVQIVFKRLAEKYAEQGEIAILARKRVGGQVVLPEAVLKLQIAA